MDQELSKYQIGNFENNELSGERYLTTQEYEKFTRSHTFILNCKQIISLYNIIVRNFNELIDYDDKLNEILLRGDYPVIQNETKNIHIDINRLLLNYMSSVRLYVDYLKTQFSRNESLKPMLDDYRLILAKCYDNSFPYRFFYKLRNYAQHIDLPIETISLKMKRISKGKYTYSIPIYFDTVSLLEKYKEWHIVKKDLENGPENLNVYDILQEHFVSVNYINNEVYLLIKIAASQHALFLNNLTRDYRNKYKSLGVFKSKPIYEKSTLKGEDIEWQQINLGLLDHYT